MTGYGVNMVLTAVASVLLLRYLGVADFGRYMTVASLIAIVGGVTDGGLTAIGGRDLALREAGEGRSALLANLLGLRLVITPLGALGATIFAIAVGYSSTLILGTALAGIGLTLTAAQATMTLPLTVDLKIARLTATETIRQAATLAGITLLVVANSGLLGFFALFVAVAFVGLAVTPPLVGSAAVWRPAFHRGEWRLLIREALPLAAAVVMGAVYVRLLVVLMSILATAVATGLFATSLRITETLFGISSLVLAVALPILATVAEERVRLRYMLDKMVEVAMIAAWYLVVVVFVFARPILELLGGDAYGHAAPVLRIQVFAVIPVFLSQVCIVALIAIRRQAVQAIAIGVALGLLLALGLVLIPVYGAIGGAIATLAAEIAQSLALLILLARCDRSLLPAFAFLWKVVVASALALAIGLVPGVPAIGTAVLMSVLYGAALWVTGAIPGEVVDAFALRRGA